MDSAITTVCAGLLASGGPSLIANRRAMRAGFEPLEIFRQYMSTYSREQAYCIFSPELVRNLEQHWNAQER
jgi:thioesterase DpgC